MQEWLANGPFAEEEDRFNGEYASLKDDPELAYLTWLNEIIGIKITVYPKDKVQLQLSDKVSQRLNTMPTTHYIHIQSNLPISLNQKNITVKACQKLTKVLIDGNNQLSDQYSSQQPLSSLGGMSLGNSYVFCIKTTEDTRQTKNVRETIEVAVLAKARITHKGTVFPLPSLDKNAIRLNNIGPPRADFTQQQKEWADNL
ncbi:MULTISPECIES: hypothetical protein [unclassified Photobacterium]|nr:MULTISPECIES: hypothetical protein [unclassified Photobacterium]PSV40250.1 hypothetical protein C9J38_07010 [Photobacterium sp. GB-210]PSV21137.1 hypothetical protein C9J42_20965 [Photobacterium sp. GB-56]PSV29416.1 hypothetical protein C9J44_21335 [Photobacterium sp. GB-27]PSV37403.1 hypothetical protein C9J46_21030 [Photobacterium sp. GB-36]PSV50296.1 hypothetical protein C9J45_20765 [Photobacterium sp. GB-1]